MFGTIQAGIERNNLSIALEPEAASVYCKYLPIDQLAGADRDAKLFTPGSKYMVIDLGGKSKSVFQCGIPYIL